MSNELVAPDKFFLNRFGMNHGALERILGSALERKADYADLYFEYRSSEGLGLEESMVNHTSKSVSHGVGERAKLLNEIDRVVRAHDPRVKNVMASFACEQKIVMIVNSEGKVAADIQPLCRLNVTVIADDGKSRQVGSYGGGGRVEWKYFIENERWREYALEAARQAIVNLDAVDAPAGETVVVLGSGWPGILLHEAIGHGLEGDFNRKGTSAFANRIGQQVA